MGLETGTYISDLVATNPTGADVKSQGDDHIRLVKATVKASFPNVSGAMTATHTELNYMVGATTNPAMKDGSNLTTPALGDSSTKIATTAFVAGTAFASALPAQTGNSGKTLTTNGTTASWIYGVPTGSEMFWPTETPPDGWLEENGASLLRSAYPDLFAVIGTTYGAVDGTHFNLPDARGMFVRGWAHGSTNDPDKATRTAVSATGATMTAGDHVGTTQLDEFEAHTHTSVVSGSVAAADIGPTQYRVSSGNTGSTGGNETRPLNTTRMMIIKY